MSQLVQIDEDPPVTPDPIQQLVEGKLTVEINSETQKKVHWLLHYWRQQVLWSIIIWVAIEAIIMKETGLRTDARSQSSLSTSQIFMFFGFLATIQSWLLSIVPHLLFIIFPIYIISRHFLNKYICFKAIELYLFRIGSFILITAYIFLINLPQTNKQAFRLTTKNQCFINLIFMSCSSSNKHHLWLPFFIVGICFFHFNATFTIFHRFNIFWPTLSPLKKVVIFFVSIGFSVFLFLLYSFTITISVEYMLKENAFPDDVGRIIWLLCTLTTSLVSYRFFIRYVHQNLDVIFSNKSYTPI